MFILKAQLVTHCLTVPLSSMILINAMAGCPSLQQQGPQHTIAIPHLYMQAQYAAAAVL